MFCRVPISFPQASLGAQIKVPTMEGQESLNVPEGTQSGSRFPYSREGNPTRQRSRQRGSVR